MSNRRRARRQPTHLHETIRVYLAMQRATTEAEFAELLAEHDRLTDADGLPRLRARTLGEFRRGCLIEPMSPRRGPREG
jgi:hypothetical protein